MKNRFQNVFSFSTFTGRRPGDDQDEENKNEKNKTLTGNEQSRQQNVLPYSSSKSKESSRQENLIINERKNPTPSFVMTPFSTKKSEITIPSGRIIHQQNAAILKTMESFHQEQPSSTSSSSDDTTTNGPNRTMAKNHGHHLRLSPPRIKIVDHSFHLNNNLHSIAAAGEDETDGGSFSATSEPLTSTSSLDSSLPIQAEQRPQTTTVVTNNPLKTDLLPSSLSLSPDRSDHPIVHSVSDDHQRRQQHEASIRSTLHRLSVPSAAIESSQNCSNATGGSKNDSSQNNNKNDSTGNKLIPGLFLNRTNQTTENNNGNNDNQGGKGRRLLTTRTKGSWRFGRGNSRGESGTTRSAIMTTPAVEDLPLPSYTRQLAFGNLAAAEKSDGRFSFYSSHKSNTMAKIATVAILLATFTLMAIFYIKDRALEEKFRTIWLEQDRRLREQQQQQQQLRQQQQQQEQQQRREQQYSVRQEYLNASTNLTFTYNSSFSSNFDNSQPEQ